MIATEFEVEPSVGGALTGVVPLEPPLPQPEIVMATARNAPATELVEGRIVNNLQILIEFTPASALQATHQARRMKRLGIQERYSCPLA